MVLLWLDNILECILFFVCGLLPVQPESSISLGKIKMYIERIFIQFLAFKIGS